MHPNASRIDQSSRLSFVRRLCATLARLARHKRGNVLMIMGFALVPMTFATGMVIDYSRAARLQTKLNAAADAASLSAVTKPMLTQSLEASCNAARRTFLNATQQYSTGLSFTAASDLQISITDSYTSGSPVTLACPMIDATVPGSFTTPITRVVAITYGARSSNAFGGVLGRSDINIGGTATSRAGLDAFYQIVFVVDVSNSMGIGGTSNDIARLSVDKTIINKGKPGCQFACHDPNGTASVQASDYCNGSPSDYFCHTNGPTYCPYGTGNCTILDSSPTYNDRRALAKLYGYKLKIDYVNDALSSFMTSLKPQMQKAPNNYSISIYTFGTNFNQFQAPTTDWATAQAAAGKIDLEVAKVTPSTYFGGGGNQGWTFTSTGLSSTLQNVANVGDGSSPTARKTYFIFLSDGVEDDFGQIVNGRGSYYNYAAKCQSVKDAGITMFSIETSYPVVNPDDAAQQYKLLVGDLPSRNNNVQIADVMKGCASSADKYFQANDGPAIQNAVSNVFASITAETARLSR